MALHKKHSLYPHFLGLAILVFPAFSGCYALAAPATSSSSPIVPDQTHRETSSIPSTSPAQTQEITSFVLKALHYTLPKDFIARAKNVLLVSKAAGVHFPPLQGKTLQQSSDEIRRIPTLMHILESSHFTPENFLTGMTSFVLTYAALHSSQLHNIPVQPANKTLLQASPKEADSLVLIAQSVQADQ